MDGVLSEPLGKRCHSLRAQLLRKEQSKSFLGARASDIKQVSIALKGVTLAWWWRIAPMEELAEIVLVPPSAKDHEYVFKLSPFDAVLRRERCFVVYECRQTD
jgi:hypothetical protein